MKIGERDFDFYKSYIMGILNITPDSFSDGGQFIDLDRILVYIEKMIEDGADIIDVGAASSRPGADEVSGKEEINRLKGLLKVYKKYFSVPISLDTTKSEVAAFGLANGVDMINDISGLAGDKKMADIIGKAKVPVVIMHMQGIPQNMQNSPSYQNVITDISEDFKVAIKKAEQAGIADVIIDPGVGFGKTLEHNLEIIANLAKFKSLGKPILVGTSRKSFIGALTGADINERLAGTISSNILALVNGASIFRVHDVAETKQALVVASAIINSIKQ
jgi:dihydropteroate synthase